MTQDNYKNNRERVIALVEAGGATKQSLCEACGFNEKSLASVFAQLRLMGKYNIKDENGVYSLVDEVTWNEHRASSSKVQPKTPKEAYDAAVKREQRAATAQTRAAKTSSARSSPTRNSSWPPFWSEKPKKTWAPRALSPMAPLTIFPCNPSPLPTGLAYLLGKPHLCNG